MALPQKGSPLARQTRATINMQPGRCGFIGPDLQVTGLEENLKLIDDII
jgi:hypothetical protein